ncbi:MAG: LamG domain-containing protein [Verrucomicrobiales bacterium]|nr:LamG domain-containing protein [Verrucomicrobiales bacterium]
MVRVGFALGIALLTATAFADVVGYFKFDNFPGDNGAFADDAGKGLRGLLGFPFSAPASVPGPSGQAGDLAVSLDGDGGLAADDSAAEILNILTPPLTLECWVRSANDAQIGRHRAFINYGIPGGPPREGLVRGGYNLGLAPSGELRFTLFAVVDVLSGVFFPFDDQWHHVAASYSIPDGGVRFYLDGVEVAFVAETREITPPGSRHLDIGAFFTGLGRFDGAIDRVRISKAALTPEQLDSVAGTVKPVQGDTAVFYNFNEGNPPYQGQRLPPAGVAVSTAEWVIDHPPRIGASAGGPQASAAGPAVVNDTPSGAAADRAIQFGGADLSVDMAAVWDPNGVLNLDGDWTLEAWVKFAAANDGDRDVIFYYGHPGRGYSLSVNYAAGNMLQVTTLGIADMPSDTAVVEPDVWQHLAVAHKNGQSITYFINGVEAGTRSYTGGTRLAETTKIFYIGAEWDGGLPFTGLIDRIRISNSALAANELDSDPKNPAAPPQPAVRLAVTRSQSNVVLSWPEANSVAYILEFSNSLPGLSWSPETIIPVVAAGQKTVTAPITESARFYRLKRP